MATTNSRALATFNENITFLSALLKLQHKQYKSLYAVAKAASDGIVAHNDQKNISEAKRVLNELEETVNVAELNLWRIVIVVTITETYLQDVMARIAQLNPSIVSSSKKWMHKFAGPRRWFDELTKMGLQPAEPIDVDVLELAWGIRHATVHNAGQPDLEFVQRHGWKPTGSNGKLHATNDFFISVATNVGRFVDDTDAFLISRCHGLAS